MHQVYQFLCANPGIVDVPLGNPKSSLFGESQVLNVEGVNYSTTGLYNPSNIFMCV